MPRLADAAGERNRGSHVDRPVVLFVADLAKHQDAAGFHAELVALEATLREIIGRDRLEVAGAGLGGGGRGDAAYGDEAEAEGE